MSLLVLIVMDSNYKSVSFHKKNMFSNMQLLKKFFKVGKSQSTSVFIQFLVLRIVSSHYKRQINFQLVVKISQ